MPDQGTWAICATMALTGAIVVAIIFTAMSKSRVLKTTGYALTAALLVVCAMVMVLGPPLLHAAKLWAVLLLVAAVWLGFAGSRTRSAKLDLVIIEAFEKWAKAPPAEEYIRVQGAANDALRNHVKEKLKQRPTNPNTVWSLDALPIELQDLLLNAQQDFGVVKLAGNGTMAATLNNATIWRLELTAISEVSLTNCKIGHVQVDEIAASFKIEDCLIGKLTVGDQLTKLEWHSGYLGQFDIKGERAGAFVSDVVFHSLTLPHTDEYHGVQSIRDAREALNARNNYVAAGLFHAAELKLTRPKKWINKISSAYWWTSLGYQAGSDFGNSIGRPVACFIVTMLALVALAYEVGTKVARKDVELYGWQLTLKDDELLRAAQYAMQSINPLNLFGSPLVVMSQKWGAIAGGTLGVTGVAVFALFFLSVRRRFKLE